MAVVGLLEAALVAIHDELPFISNIILQSDNAKSYQNHYLTFMIQDLNMKMMNKIFISQMVNTETQDGKTILDLHFGVSTKQF